MRPKIQIVQDCPDIFGKKVDVYFSVDVETDGSIPGPYSMLSFALVYAGAFDGETFYRPMDYSVSLYSELQPISEEFEQEALDVNGLDRARLATTGLRPDVAMTEAAEWVRRTAGGGDPVFVAYPLSFDWTWMYWYFIRYSKTGSPFGYSRCFDIKTAIALALGRTVGSVGRKRLPSVLQSKLPHTHHALDDAVSQAEIFANIFSLEGAVV
jgi:hypothetical protein